MAGLEDLYREIILDHYRNPRNRGELPSPPARRAEGFNPLCGDEVVVYLAVDDGVVADVRVDGRGCSISQSSASMMSAAVKGKSLSEARALLRAFRSMVSGSAASGPSVVSGSSAPASDGRPGADAEIPTAVDMGELEALQGVVKFPARVKCATLSWNALAQGLDEPEPPPA